MNLEKAKLVGKTWMAKVRVANTNFNKWEKKFKCKKMVEYFEGKQWNGDPNGEAYVLNLIYSTIEVKEPALLFNNPKFFISPAPSGQDFDPESAFSKALYATDMLNTLVNKKTMAFSENVGMSIKDSFFRFGMIEIGYDATWKLNPNANKATFKADNDSEAEPGEVEDQPEEIPEEEWIYVKRIPPERFRIGTDDCFQLEKTNWVGYYEYMRLSDIKAPKSGFKNTDELPDPTYTDDEYLPEDESVIPVVHDMTKVWKLWDLRSKKMRIVVESGEVVIFEKEFIRLPFKGLRFSKRTTGWLPIPPVFNWKSAQDEQNESKEQLRTHRRRSKRAFQVVRGQVDPEELDKLINGADGVTIEVERADSINAIGNTPVDSSTIASMQVSKDDFNIIAGTTVERSLQTDNSTATQATIVNQRATLRETKEQEVVALWLCEIGLEVIEQAIEKMTMPIWIKLSLDVGSWGGEFEVNKAKYEKLHTDYLKGVGFNVDVQMSSMSPIANDEEMNRYLRFLSVLTQFPVISLHPDLIRETAYRLGYRNEKVIKYFMEAAQLAMIAKIEQGKQQAQQMGLGNPQATGPSQDSGGQGGDPAQRTVNNMAPPELSQIATQLGQVGMPQGG